MSKKQIDTLEVQRERIKKILSPLIRLGDELLSDDDFVRELYVRRAVSKALGEIDEGAIRR